MSVRIRFTHRGDPFDFCRLAPVTRVSVVKPGLIHDSGVASMEMDETFRNRHRNTLLCTTKKSTFRIFVFQCFFMIFDDFHWFSLYFASELLQGPGWAWSEIQGKSMKITKNYEKTHFGPVEYFFIFKYHNSS